MNSGVAARHDGFMVKRGWSTVSDEGHVIYGVFSGVTPSAVMVNRSVLGEPAGCACAWFVALFVVPSVGGVSCTVTLCPI